MNIRHELLKSQLQSRENALRVAEYACTSPENFEELMNCFLSSDSRLAQRAAWSVSWAADKSPSVIKPHIASLVTQLARKDIHDAVIRNSLRILQNLEIPEQFHGPILNVCFEFVQSRVTSPAIKAFSLTVLFRLSKLYPEIKNELREVIVQNIEYETAAFRSRGKKILACL